MQGCERIDFVLDFVDRGPAKAWQEVVARDGVTEVTWHYESDLGFNPKAKVYGLMVEGYLGPEFERGLSALETQVEKLPAVDFYALHVETVHVAGSQALMMHVESSKDAAAVQEALAGAYRQIGEYAASQRLVPFGSPFALTTSSEGEKYLMEAGIPVQDAPPDPTKEVPPAPLNSPVRIGVSPTGHAAKAVHKGSYATLATTHEQLQAWLAFHKLEKAGAVWEVFLSPAGTAEAEQETEIYYPIN